MAKVKTDDVGAMLKSARKAAGDFGKFYTPECLGKLITLLAGKPGRILDPTCGCGSLLVYAHELLGDSFYVGQEIDPHSCELARKNLHDNGCEQHEILCCDTLTESATWTEKFDCILANPPFSVKWDPKACPFDPRFNGVYAPKSKADLAFVQHGLYWLKDGGTAAYILPPGALTRGSSEEKIREQILPYVRAVISLPEKLFDETAISTVCVLFEKTVSDAPIYFYDASKMIEAQNKKQNVITDDQIAEIVDDVRERREIKYKSAVIDRDAIRGLAPNTYIEHEPSKEKNVYDDWTPIQVIEDGEAWAEYTYRFQRQMNARIRKELGYEFNQEDLDFDVETIKPKTYDLHKAQGRIH